MTKMNFVPVSRFLNHKFPQSTRLADESYINKQPLIGSILYDDLSDHRPVRSYQNLVGRCPAVYSYDLDEVFLSDEFILHDFSKIFVDTSIQCQSSAGRKIPEILANFSSRIANCDSTADLKYKEEHVLVLHNEGGSTWGHFLVQTFPKVLFFAKFYEDFKIALPSAFLEDRNGSFRKAFELFGISQERLIAVDRFKTYRIRKASIVDFPYNFDLQIPHPATLDFFDNIAFVPDDNEVPKKLFIRRVPFTKRLIENLAQVEGVARDFGYSSNELGSQNLVRQLTAWRNADVIVSTLGSDLTNILFSKNGQRIVALSPDWFGDTFFYNLAVMKSVEWNEIRCGKKSAHDNDADVDHKVGFEVDIQALKVMLSFISRTSLERP